MKFLRLFILFSVISFTLVSCTKEFSAESGAAIGSLKDDASGDCLPATVNGNYQKDTVLTSSNSVDIQINIDQVGSYFIHTDTVNGYSFSAFGEALALGVNTVHLVGSGKPLAVGSGVDVFTVSFDTSRCTFNVVVTGTGGGGTTAVYSLGGSPGTCTGAVTGGTYMQGLATTASNTATINVNVTQLGTYSLTSTTVNGVTFSGSGSFTSLGANTIVLTAAGTPTAAGPFNYSLTAGAGNCSFSVTYLPAAAPASFTFDCSTLTPVANGEFRYGVALDPATNNVTVTVNVLTIGSYTITSTPSTGGPDGVIFGTSGVFTTTGNQTLTIPGNGTPTRPAIVFYNISSPQATNATPCSTAAYYDFITMSIDGGPVRNFSFDCATLLTPDTPPGYDFFEMFGNASATSNEAIDFGVGIPTGGTFTTTTYTVNQYPASVAAADYTDPAANDYVIQSIPGTPQTPGFSVTFSFITSVRAEGTFTGTVKDNAGAGPGVHTVTGSFGLKR